MATAYVAADAYCASDYCEVEVSVAPTTMAFPVPLPGEYVAATPDPRRVTITASPPSTNLAEGEYAMVVALVLATHAGSRIISQVAVDPIYAVPPAVGRYTCLLDLDTITLGQGGAGSTLVTRINSLERPNFSFVVDNSDGFWSQLVASEYLLGMTVSLYLDLGDGEHLFCGRGEISDIDIRRKTATIHVGA